MSSSIKLGEHLLPLCKVISCVVNSRDNEANRRVGVLRLRGDSMFVHICSTKKFFLHNILKITLHWRSRIVCNIHLAPIALLRIYTFA